MRSAGGQGVPEFAVTEVTKRRRCPLNYNQVAAVSIAAQTRTSSSAEAFSPPKVEHRRAARPVVGIGNRMAREPG